MRVGLIGHPAKLACGRRGLSRRTADSRLRTALRILLSLALFCVEIQGWSQRISTIAPADKVLSGADQDANQNPNQNAAQNAAPRTQPNPTNSEVQTPAQPAPGSIHGVVVDPDGDVYEDATVELVQSGSGIPILRSVKSDSDGAFSFAGVPAGAFKLTISSSGFAPQVLSGVLHPGEDYNAKPIVLLATSATSEVRVTASTDEIAVEELHQEEQQRVLGVIPNFYVTYDPNAPPLTSGQKFNLAWKSSIDPISFLAAGVFAGIEQASNSFSGYGQGAEGYGKRYGASFADNFVGNMIGGAILPSLLKQDPRYFYKGTGTIRSRVFYAIANSVVCKGDKGHWQTNYSAIAGGLAAGGISNLYYPASNRSGVTLSFENAAIGTAASAAQNLFQEFVVRKLTPRIPNYGSSKP